MNYGDLTNVALAALVISCASGFLKVIDTVSNRANLRLQVLPTPINQIANSVERFETESIANWRKLSNRQRKNCVGHLKKLILQFEDGNALLAKWKQQRHDGLRIGSDEHLFHIGTGMWVRNTLRDVLIDENLPPVKYGNGEARNWDDYYYGALDELAGSL